MDKHAPFLVFAAALAAALPMDALAQERIGLGTVRGELTASSPKAGDGTPYVLYEYRSTPGERVVIEMSSDAFDAFVAAGSVVLPMCEDQCEADDDSGGDLNSRLRTQVPANGRLQILANAIDADSAGPFTLSVAKLPPLAAPRQTDLRVPGQASGRFGDSTARDGDDLPFEIWVLRGEPGQRVQVDMVSQDLDSVLAAHPGRPQEPFEATASDDDGGGELNARMRLRLGDDGTATVRAGAFGSGDGAYTISTRALPPPAARPEPRTLEPGQAVQGEFGERDWLDEEDNRYVHIYRITGQPGERIVVRMESSDVDSLLRWGVFDGDRFEQDATDDDSGGDLNARLTVTLDAQGQGRLLVSSVEEYGTGRYRLSAVRAAASR